MGALDAAGRGETGAAGEFMKAGAKGAALGGGAGRAGTAAGLTLAVSFAGGRVIFGTIISQRAPEVVGRTASSVPATSSAIKSGAGALGTPFRGAGAAMGASVRVGAAEASFGAAGI